MKNRKPNLDVARHDPALSIMDVVRAAPHRKKAPGPLDVTQRHNGAEIRVQGPYFLTELDQTVLLVLLALGYASGKALPPDDPAHAELEPRGGARSEWQWIIRTSYSSLAQVTYRARPGGKNIAAVIEALDRLRAVTVIVRAGDESADSRLLSARTCGDDIVVTLCGRLAAGLFTDAHYIQIDLADRLSLTGSVARIIHAWLCGRIKEGDGVWVVSLDDLTARVYGPITAKSSTISIAGKARRKTRAARGRPRDEKTVAADRQRKRRERIRRALQEIAELPRWIIVIEVDNARIERKGRVRAESESRARTDGHGESGNAVTDARTLGHAVIATSSTIHHTTDGVRWPVTLSPQVQRACAKELARAPMESRAALVLTLTARLNDQADPLRAPAKWFRVLVDAAVAGRFTSPSPVTTRTPVASRDIEIANQRGAIQTLERLIRNARSEQARVDLCRQLDNHRRALAQLEANAQIKSDQATQGAA